MTADNDAANERMREVSGHVTSEDRLVAFLYALIRDHVQPSQVEELLNGFNTGATFFIFTNGWLATYAKDIAMRLQSKAPVDANDAPSKQPIEHPCRYDWPPSRTCESEECTRRHDAGIDYREYAKMGPAERRIIEDHVRKYIQENP